MRNEPRRKAFGGAIVVVLAALASSFTGCTDDFSVFEGTPGELPQADASTAGDTGSLVDRSAGDHAASDDGSIDGDARTAPETGMTEAAGDAKPDLSNPDMESGTDLDALLDVPPEQGSVDATADVGETGNQDGGGEAADATIDRTGRDAEAGVCGGVGAPCCAGNVCSAGAVCNGGMCRACGGSGQICCAGSTCGGRGCCIGGACIATGDGPINATTACVDGAVVACGGVNQPCCARNSCGAGRCCVAGHCIAPGTTCGGAVLGTCNMGEPRCGGGPAGNCGAIGRACCPGNPNATGNASDFCTQSGAACDSSTGMCAACGGPGQPCCDGEICNGGGCCDSNAHHCVANGAACPGGQGACNVGGCQGGACGRLGEPCCGGGVGCSSPFSACVNNSCVACGGVGQPCCTAIGGTAGTGFCGEPFTCDRATSQCVACGAQTNQCCAGAVCPGRVCNLMNVCQ